MFTVTIYPDHQLMKIRVDGFWTPTIMGKYLLELRRQSAALTARGGCKRILVDMSDYPIQSKDIADGHAEALRYARNILGANAALIMTTALSRLQASRVARSTGHEFFADERSAMDWLLDQS